MHYTEIMFYVEREPDIIWFIMKANACKSNPYLRAKHGEHPNRWNSWNYAFVLHLLCLRAVHQTYTKRGPRRTTSIWSSAYTSVSAILPFDGLQCRWFKYGPMVDAGQSRFISIWKYSSLCMCIYNQTYVCIIEGSLEVKLPTICRDGKAEVGRVREEKSRSEKIRDGESQKRQMQVHEKVGKSRLAVFFPMICGPVGSKSNLAKAAGRSQLAKWEMKKRAPLWREAHFQVKMYKTRQLRTTFGSWDVEKVTPLWREAHFQVKMYKTRQLLTTFGSWDVEKVHAVVVWSTFPSQNGKNTTCSDHFLTSRPDVEKVHAVVARSTCPSQNVQNTSASDHFWKLRCRKSHAVVARSTFPSQNVQNTSASDHFWKLRCRKSARRCGVKHISKSKW